jgi:hypothetical protein
VAATGELGERHGTVVLGEAGEECFERLGASQSGIAGLLEK